LIAAKISGPAKVFCWLVVETELDPLEQTIEEINSNTDHICWFSKKTYTFTLATVSLSPVIEEFFPKPERWNCQV
jgi:hypothetical protein